MPCNEQGSSLIELMIGTGIMGILLALYINSHSRLESDSALQAAREDAHDQVILTLNMIRKNVRSKVPGTTVDVSGESFQFSQRLVDGSIQQIRAVSRCRALPGETLTVIAKDSIDSACLSRLNCQGVPYLEIQQEGANGTIQVREFPSQESFQRHIKKKVSFAGLGLCVDKGTDSLRVRGIEVLFSRHKDSRTDLHINGLTYQMLDEGRNAIELIR